MLFRSWRMWVLCDREPVREWTKGRVTMIGDAAHPMLQYLAAGAGMAMEDDICLDDTLEAKGGEIERSFLEYPRSEERSVGKSESVSVVLGGDVHNQKKK